MLRLTFILCLTIYCGLVIGAEQATEPTDTATLETTVSSRGTPEATPSDGNMFVTADGRALRIAEVIEPARLDTNADPRDVMLVATPSAAEIVTASASVPDGSEAPDLVEVTGSVVNVRQGPSTQDAVLTSLPRGTVVALVGWQPNGWARIEIENGGATGFMSGDFLAQAD